MWVHLPCLPITHITIKLYSTIKKGKIKMIPTYTSVDQLPLTLCAEHVAMALGISRAGAYTLLHSKGFPTIKIGKRLVVPRDQFIKWMETQVRKIWHKPLQVNKVMYFSSNGSLWIAHVGSCTILCNCNPFFNYLRSSSMIEVNRWSLLRILLIHAIITLVG